MRATILDETRGKVQVAPLTVAQYEAMLARGILREGEPIELLDGLLVLKDRAAAGGDPMAVGPHHHLCVNELARLLPQFTQRGCYLSIQGPVRLPPRDEPEPDGAVIVGAVEDFAEQHPGPGAIACVIEVADSSLQRDRTTKLRIYAAAGIPQYVLVNLVDLQVEVFTSPLPKKGQYARSSVRTGRQSVSFAAGGRAMVKALARDLLP